VNTLRDLVLKRLDANTKPEDEWSALVLAALEGPDELAQLLDEQAPDAPKPPSPRAPAKPPAEAASPRIAFLKAITVEGFRGIGPKATLDLTPGPGLTLVVGRNGSGKSSFAEALELLLTGETYRWENRSKVWKDGWRNLHHPKARIAAELALEGEKGTCTVARDWADGSDLGAAETWAQVHGRPRTGVAALGWETPLAAYRPFLSYNELGSMLDEGPSKLYDALSKVLGLDALVDAQAVLTQARTAREKAQKDADQDRKSLLARIEGTSDERAAKVREALGAKDWGLDTLESILAGSSGAGEPDTAAGLLGRLAALAPPDPAKVQAATQALRHAAERQKAAAQTVAGRSEQLAALLDHALRFHEAHGDGPCPVCGREKALDADWHRRKAQEAADLRHAAREATDANAALKAAAAEVRRLLAIDLDLVRRAQSADLPAMATAAANAIGLRFSHGPLAALRHPEPGSVPADATPATAIALAAAVDEALPDMVISVDQLRQAAAEALRTREDAWRPHALALAEWLPKVRAAREAAASLPLLKKAEKWLKEAADDIRNERFAPIADQTRAIWDQLRLQSNVSLEKVHLGGAGKARKVELEVTVDGQQGAALGVMSQGELHSLALSLFLPRATLEESPFRFVVIDDPVQSMDPARVDGLARVLHGASRDRQVVVFTHDDRLPEAVRRLGIPATQVEVTRRDGSVVALRQARDPVSRHLDDALTLARTDDLPPEVARRVVPGLCRQAIEAACMEAIRRRRIGRGEPHADVEALLSGLTGTKSLAALALFDDAARAGDVLPRLDRESRAGADTFRAVNEGSHETFRGDLLGIVRSAEKLARWMQTLP
jgi:predicted ATPase